MLFQCNSANINSIIHTYVLQNIFFGIFILYLKYWTLYVYVYLPSYTNSKLIYPRFLWMVRIGGGVFPVIKEPDYLVNGDYRVDKGAAPKMLNCLM